MVSTPTSGPAKRGTEADLVATAAKWIDEALKAWTDDDYAKVALVAPIAVEHLGKAVLWNRNPVLLVPLAADYESSLFALATKPDLGSPSLRTIGLATVLARVEKLLGVLPVVKPRQRRIIDIRNGAIHTGTHADARHVLLDCLSLCNVFLEPLKEEARTFFGTHHQDAVILLDQKRTEVARRVLAKKARARRHLGELEKRLGAEVFKIATDRLEEQAAESLNVHDSGKELWGVDAKCPECGFKGRLFGRIDATAEIDYDVEPVGGGEYDSISYLSGWSLMLSPQAFSCNVCQLTLEGAEELTEGRLPDSRHAVDTADLGEDFSAEEFAESEFVLVPEYKGTATLVRE